MAATDAKLEQVRLKIPAADADLARLKLGSVVFLEGVIYTAREGVYQKVLADGAALPEGLTDISNANFHCSPAASVNEDGSYNVGGVTATASFRFSKWMAAWFETAKAKVIIGKGGMSSDDYKNIFVPNGAIYLTTVGYGTGALLGRGIKGVRAAHWIDELGIAQALWVYDVENFGPFLVDSDLEGNSLFEQQGRLVNENLDRVYAGLKSPSLSRYGETDDRSKELI